MTGLFGDAAAFTMHVAPGSGQNDAQARVWKRSSA